MQRPDGAAELTQSILLELHELHRQELQDQRLIMTVSTI